VLDGLFCQDTILDIQKHFTDTGGASDHIFGLFALIRKRPGCTTSRTGSSTRSSRAMPAEPCVSFMRP
jgi:hypothetical protein